MDNGYAARNMLSVTRTRYTGTRNTVSERKCSVAAVPEDKRNGKVNVSAPRTVAECAGVKEKYRVSKVSTMPVSAGREAVAEGTAKGGFVYVEHCGFTGTFRDAFCTRRVKSAGNSCFDKIVLVLLFAVLMFFVAGSYCEYYEAFRTSKEIRVQIDECREEQSKLLVAIEERNNNMNIEEYAMNTLGMVKSDKLTKYYINISEKDVVDITVNEKDEDVSGGVLLSGFKSVMSNFVGAN